MKNSQLHPEIRLAMSLIAAALLAAVAVNAGQATRVVHHEGGKQIERNR